jgi:hypothetical protein
VVEIQSPNYYQLVCLARSGNKSPAVTMVYDVLGKLSSQAFMLIRNWRTRFCSRMKTCAAGMRSASSFKNQEAASTTL